VDLETRWKRRRSQANNRDILENLTMPEKQHGYAIQVASRNRLKRFGNTRHAGSGGSSPAAPGGSGVNDNAVRMTFCRNL
jgi:hypothetical protein